MVSAAAPGKVLFYMKSPQGNKALMLQAITAETGPGGSSEGVIANTPEKWMLVPVTSAPTKDGYFYGGCELEITFIPDANVTLDISDARFNIPLTRSNGTLQVLGNNTTDMDGYLIGDVALVAGVETQIARHKIKEGERVMFGGGRLWFGLENNA